MRDDRERLLDMLEAIDRIQRYATNREALQQSELIQNWVVSHIQRIGEAARGLSDALKASHPAVPWNKIIGMRHVLVHNYFEIDLEIVAAVLENDLPILREQLRQIIAKP